MRFLKLFIFCTVLIFTLRELPGHAGATSSNTDQLKNTLEKFLSEIKTTSNPKKKYASVLKFKKQIDETLKISPNEFTRKTRSSLHGLQYYFNAIDENLENPSPEVCDHAKARVIMGFSPKNDYPEYTPPEAKAALEAVEALCK